MNANFGSLLSSGRTRFCKPQELAACRCKRSTEMALSEAQQAEIRRRAQYALIDLEEANGHPGSSLQPAAPDMR
jgi:hypothetical protein